VKYTINFCPDIMKREELLPIAQKHGFGGFEVGCRMLDLVAEIETVALDKAYQIVASDIAQLEQENRQLHARIARLTELAGDEHATS